MRATGIRWLAYAAGAMCLGACGGGIDATIGGSLSGLNAGSTVVLQNNDTDSTTLSANGAFTFDSPIADSGTYNVDVLTQPVGETCSVANGSGTVDTLGDPVNSVSVTCIVSASLGGTVTGLPAGTSVTLSNGGIQLAIAANGGFAFPGTLPTGSSYDVTVAVQPAGHSCSVSNPTGTIAAGVVATVAVTCS